MKSPKHLNAYFRNKYFLFGFAFLGLAVCILIYFLLSPSGDFPEGEPGPLTLVTVSNGETGSSIAKDLYRAGVVKKSSTFVHLLTQDSAGQGIAPGEHKVQTHLPVLQALAQMLDQKRIVNQIIVKDASTLASVLSQLENDHDLKQSVDLTKVSIPLPNPSHSLEGELAPDQYSYAPGTNVDQALAAMTRNASANFSQSGITSGYKKYSPYQLLTIASLIQIESDPSDYEKVASVIYNRLAINMPLQLNSTVAYAGHLQGQIGLSTAQTRINSPYNTYIHTGLPPTPICNPTVPALRATLHPVRSNWLYFITVSPHDTRFTSTFQQFESWVTLYNHNVAMGAFK